MLDKPEGTQSKDSWLVVSNIFYVHPYLGKIANLTNIVQRGWFNHQPVRIPYVPWWDDHFPGTPGTAQPAAGLEIREAKGMGVYVKARKGGVIFQRGRTGAGPEHYCTYGIITLGGWKCPICSLDVFANLCVFF